MNSIEFEPDRTEGSYIKVFLLSDMESLKPLCPSKKLDCKAQFEMLVVGNSFRPGEISLDSGTANKEVTDLDNAGTGVVYEKYDPLSEELVTTLQSISDGIIR